MRKLATATIWFAGHHVLIFFLYPIRSGCRAQSVRLGTLTLFVVYLMASIPCIAFQLLG